jgi:hypothetical protein
VSADPNLSRIENAWLSFVRNMRDILVLQTDDRPLDQYLAFRDEALALVESNEFLVDLKNIWTEATAPESTQPTPEQVSQRTIVNQSLSWSLRREKWKLQNSRLRVSRSSAGAGSGKH